MEILKFGGTSVGSSQIIRNLAEIVLKHQGPQVLVVSAMAGATDTLIGLAKTAEGGFWHPVNDGLYELRKRHNEVVQTFIADPERRGRVEKAFDLLFSELGDLLHGVSLLKEATSRSLDLISGFGERINAIQIAAILEERGLNTVAIDARDILVTDASFGRAIVDNEISRKLSRERLLPLLEGGVVPVVTGFIARTPGGIATTLGRGGSDYTASLLGAYLDARKIVIWTDVSGVMTADPRLVKEARPLPRVSFREAAEMANFGAKVLHPKTVLPAVQAGIPLHIKNTFRPDDPGTEIVEDLAPEHMGVKTVSSISGLALMTIEGNGMLGVPGIARRVFTATASRGVNVIMISQSSSEHGISIVIAAEETDAAREALEDEFEREIRRSLVDRIVVKADVSILALIGEGMQGHPGTSGRLFDALGRHHVNILAIAQGSSELNISVVVTRAMVQRAVRAVHTAFGLTRMVNVFLYGCGNVGRTLIRQIIESRPYLAAGRNLQVQVLGVCNRSHYLFEEQGLTEATLEHLRDGTSIRDLPEATPYKDGTTILDALESGRYTDVAFVDVTDADAVNVHLGALERGFSVVTANKKPVAAPYPEYARLKELVREGRGTYHFETTFGAGLPVLFTLQDLLATGDEIVEIRGCFSGSLGYICSELEQGRPLSVVVRDAHERGYTEPDPREDLGGMDVARKALIIAREVGQHVDLTDITVRGLVDDPATMGASSLDEFWEQLPSSDAIIRERFAEAKAKGASLRYVATIRKDGLEIGLKEVASSDPLGQLHGPDNILIYRTRRYDENPLIIRGPGAGAEVTAAGVLGDIIKVAWR